ncbi:ParB/RepB/Spo0J family partition protein [Dactylosporangium sp. NPDC050688]|uniref:ParB/RepB/Spo0J family partition protein n=1 Tax=Dactylosporangium sp. NPDC050688 TaxID=3157217 RepID=UPI0033F1D4C0
MPTTTATKPKTKTKAAIPAETAPDLDVQQPNAEDVPQPPKANAAAPAETAPGQDEQQPNADDVPELPGRYKALRIDQIQPNPANIRDNAQALPGIVDNLLEDGIAGLIAPLIVIPFGEPDRYLAVDGEQRYWSAVEAKQTYVQAIIRDDLAGNVEQIISMLRQVHRTDPTAHQLANGIEQLALYGMSDEDIARRTGYASERVTAARAVAKLGSTIVQRAEQYGLDIFQQSTLAEFTDDPDAAEKLLEEAEEGPFAFDRAVEELRTARAAQQAATERRAELAAAAVTVLTERVDTYLNPTTQRVDALRTGDGQRISDEDHAACPSHAVAVFVGYGSRPVEITYCTEWKARGHVLADHVTAARKGPMTEQEKAERRTVIANNKGMEAANAVRRKWLSGLLAGAALPKDADKLIAEVVADPGYLLGVWVNGGRKMLDELLSPGKTKRPGARRVPARASKTQYQMITLAGVVAAHESAIARTSWRAPDAGTAAFLRWCTLNGYKAGKVEQLIIDAATRHTTGAPRLTLVTDEQPAAAGHAEAADEPIDLVADDADLDQAAAA